MLVVGTQVSELCRKMHRLSAWDVVDVCFVKVLGELGDSKLSTGLAVNSALSRNKQSRWW